jgi:transcriptional regulator with XRE-family HTH domain
MSEPNTSLRAVRQSMRLSQDELARAVREAGQRAGEPNGCTKRLVQRWEAGSVTTPRGAYVRALEYVTGQPVENLGFKPADERYGLDRDRAMDVGGGSWIPLEDPKAKGPLTGIWLSRYEYVSSSRDDATFAGLHYVVIIHHGARLQVRSVPASASRLMMDLTANGAVLTGTWTEQTRPDGYYQGSVYHGAIQFLLDPTGHRMTGKWVGFGRDFDLNTGPWSLQLVSSDTGKEAMRRYNANPEPASTEVVG